MLVEIILFFFLGVFAGTLTGLIPGIHINLVGVSLVALSASFLSFLNPIYLTVLIVSMAITHTFIDFIPSVLLGCPDTDTELSVLPGHEFLKKGRGYEAIVLATYGSFAAIFILILISLPSFFVIPKVYPLLQKIMPYFLILISFLLIFIEKRKYSALLVFFLTGFLGYLVLNINYSNFQEPLLPLLTGLFGTSMLIVSIKNKIRIPKQKITKPDTKEHSLFKPLLGAIIASPFSSFLPGLGSGQAAIIGNTISRTNRKEFLILLGATNTLVMGFSFITLYLISRTRTGAAVAIKEITGNFSLNVLFLILIVIILSGICGFYLTLVLAKFFSKKITKIKYTIISTYTLVILFFLVFVVSGLIGVLILSISTLTGLYCISLGIRRTHMMGCLLFPTILFYLT